SDPRVRFGRLKGPDLTVDRLEAAGAWREGGRVHLDVADPDAVSAREELGDTEGEDVRGPRAQERPPDGPVEVFRQGVGGHAVLAAGAPQERGGDERGEDRRGDG